MDTLKLPCILTDKQLDERRDNLVMKLSQVKLLEEEKSISSKDFKRRIVETMADISEIASEIKSRSEIREVEVETTIDHERGIEEVIRRDTGEVVRTRVLSPSERQGVLRFARGEQERDQADAEA
jgi:hypothetical protein